MPTSLRVILAGLIGALIAIAAVWEHLGDIKIDFLAYAPALFFLPAPAAICAFYTFWRRDETVAAAMFALCFIVLLGPCSTILNYLFLGAIGPRVDMALASADRAIGIDWPALVTWSAAHPLINGVLFAVYRISIVQIFLTVLFLGIKADHPYRIGQLSLSIGISGVLTILIWSMVPSIGAAAVYTLSPHIQDSLRAAVDGSYSSALIELYDHHPHYFSGVEVRGLVGFPSFHTAEAVIATWYLRKNRYVFPLAIGFNLLTLISCPIQGGHHVMDVFGGIAVSAIAIAIADPLVKRLSLRESVVQKEAGLAVGSPV